MSNEILSLLLQNVLSGILRTVLIMSAAGSALALILFAIKILTSPGKGIVSESAKYWAWKIVLAAFLVPFSLFLSIPIYTPTTDIQNFIKETVVPNQEIFEETAKSITTEDTDAQQIGAFCSKTWIDNLKFISLGVSFVLFVTTCIQYRVFAKKLRLARLPARKEDVEVFQKLASNRSTLALYRNPLVPTAMLVGVFRPTIYLPDINYSETQLENILLHELTHCRRHDVLIKWFSAWLTQLHWFNPLAYLVRRELNRACELSCDAAAIKDFDNRKKQEYGDTLISVAAEAKIPSSMISTAVCEEKKNLKNRLTAIMNSKNSSRAAMVFSCVFVALILCITVVFAAASTTNLIDPSSVISASVSHISYYTQAADEYSERVVSDEDLDALLSLVNSYGKMYDWNGYIPPFGDSRDNSDYRVRIDRTDGGYYILHYWYWSGFSFNPLHFGEDAYRSLLTSFDAKGNIGTTWRLEYAFDNAFAAWWSGGAQELAEYEKKAAERKAKTWKAVVSLDDYFSVEEVSAWIEEYDLTVERIYMWPEGETGRLALYVENGNIQDELESYIGQVEEDGSLLDNPQFRKDHERLLNGEYKVFALTIASSDGTLSLFNQLKLLKWNIDCISHVKLMDSGNSREMPIKPDGAL